MRPANVAKLAVACLVSACGGVAPQPTAGPVAPAVIEVATPALPRSDFVVVPAELLDEGVLARIPHRVRIRRTGTSWLRESGSPAGARSTRDAAYVLPAIDEKSTKIRIVFEDDKARLALWIAREDTWDTLAVPTQLSDRDGKAWRDAGIWALQGAPLDSAKRDGSRRRVRIRDPLLKLVGHVSDRVVTKVWIAGEGDPPPTFEAGRDPKWKLPADKRPRVRFIPNAMVFPEPKSTEPIVVIDSDEVVGFAGDVVDGFRRVEIVRPHARIRGFVRASEVTNREDEIAVGSTGGGHGFGMSHADRIEVPAGACLYDQINGEVVGVQSKPSIRLGRSRHDDPKWSMVYVGTHWSLAKVYVRDTSDDPKQPKWEICTQPPPP